MYATAVPAETGCRGRGPKEMAMLLSAITKNGRKCASTWTAWLSAPIDTTFQMFGKTYRYPFFAGPVGAVQLHYGTELTDLTYNDILVSACADCGIAAFTGDGTNAEVMKAACAAIKKCGSGIQP